MPLQKNNLKRLSLFSLAAVMLSSIAVMPNASAQQATDQAEQITMSPSSRRISSDAGATVTGSMKVINDGDLAYNFTVYARPYSVNSEDYDPNFNDPKPNTNLYKWVQFQKTDFRAEPGETVVVPYVIRIPANATPGGHYGVLFAETEERGMEGTGVARQKRVGKVVYATVNGEYKTGGSLKEFILPFWQYKAPIVSAARVENTGNTDFETKVGTVATDMFGRQKFRYTGDPIVLPDTTRRVEMKWANAPSFGLFKVTQTVEFLDQKHKNSGYLLIAPLWFPLLLIGLILAGVAYAVLKRRKNRR